MDGLLPPLGPIDVARFALDLTGAQLVDDSTVRRRLDGADPDLIAVVDALSRLACLLVQLVAHGLPSTGVTGAANLLDLIRTHQQARSDLDGLDEGRLP